MERRETVFNASNLFKDNYLFKPFKNVKWYLVFDCCPSLLAKVNIKRIQKPANQLFTGF